MDEKHGANITVKGRQQHPPAPRDAVCLKYKEGVDSPVHHPRKKKACWDWRGTIEWHGFCTWKHFGKESCPFLEDGSHNFGRWPGCGLLLTSWIFKTILLSRESEDQLLLLWSLTTITTTTTTHVSPSVAFLAQLCNMYNRAILDNPTGTLRG